MLYRAAALLGAALLIAALYRAIDRTADELDHAGQGSW